MSEHTPTTGQVRDAFARDGLGGVPAADVLFAALFLLAHRRESQMAAEKAKWQAEALRDAVRDMRAARQGSWNLPDPLDPEVAYSVDVWLEVRANRIVKGADR